MTNSNAPDNTPHYLRYACYAPGWNENIYADLKRISEQHGGEFVEELFYYDYVDDKFGSEILIEMQVWHFATRQQAQTAALAWLEDAGLPLQRLSVRQINRNGAMMLTSLSLTD